MNTVSRVVVALSTRTTVDVLVQASAPVHDLMAGDADSEARLIVAKDNVVVSTGLFISLVLIVRAVGWSQTNRVQSQVAG